MQSVSVLGLAVTVGYEDERKFASAAASVARTGRQIFDLTWRKRVMKDVVTYALRELRGDDVREWRRKISKLIL